MDMTVNQALTLLKSIKSRIKELEGLRDKVSTKDIFFGSAQKNVEPQYDVKNVDEKIVELQKMHFELDNAIKTSNAVTQIAFSGAINIDSVFESIK